MNVSMRFTGGKELEAALRQLPEAVARRATQAAMKEATKELVEDLRAAAPELTGHGAESIHSEARGPGIVIGPSDKALKASGLGFAEFGTSHQPARPWIRPAWDSHKQQIVRDLGAAWWASIIKAARRLARKSQRAR